jgi:CRP/FNR family transcriptional regulator, cyclic AMP receptor protein
MTTPYFELFTRGEQNIVTFAAGEPVFVAGDAAEFVYVVRSGAVVLHDGDQLLETVGEGGIFGEMALVDGLGRSASATASRDCELVALDERRFQYLVSETPYFAQAVMRVMCERLRRPQAASGEGSVERDGLGGDRGPVEALDGAPASGLSELQSPGRIAE